MSSRRPRISLAMLFGSPSAAVTAAFLLRFFFLWLSHHHEDIIHSRFVCWGLEALMIANSLATGHGFAEPFPHYVFTTAWLAPVYPWLVSFGQLLFHLRGHALAIFAQVLNIIFSSLTCYPIYFLAKRIYGPSTALGATWLWAFLPTAILMPIEWTWDQSLSALLLCLLLCFTYHLGESSSPGHWAAYGLLWGVAALTNPALCLLLPFLAAWLWFRRARRALPSGRLLTRTALYFVLLLLPWTIRNYFELGGLFFVKSDFGVAFWLGNNPQVKDTITPQLHPMENYPEFTLLVLNTEPVYNRLKQREALAFIRANPKTFLKLFYNRAVDTWTGKYDSRLDTYIQPLGAGRLYLWYNTVFSLLAFAGLLVGLWTRARDSLPLAFCLLLFPIPYYIVSSSLRYRHPIDPVMTIFVVLTWATIGALLRRRKVFSVRPRTCIPEGNGKMDRGEKTRRPISE
ncbi:MAG TPA: glycosyltransferase family 39 protein [Candidatus Dormibacteraeota bacterium]|nr:glycosyltransferase family 39 protein [Candidatus Dormibacteraeota bacterium]